MGRVLQKNKRWQVCRLMIQAVIGICLSLPLYTWGTETMASWNMQDMSGKSHRLSQYRGSWLVVNFWAPWCPPCLEEMPELVTFYDQHQHEKVMVLGVAVQYDTEQSVRDYMNDMLISYPIILGETQKNLFTRPEVLPTTYIYAPDGTLYKVKRGALSKQWLESLLKNAAAESKTAR